MAVDSSRIQPPADSRSRSSEILAELAANQVTIGRYAEVLAHLYHFPIEKAPEVIARLGLSEDEWSAADVMWTEALRHASRTDAETALLFTSTFARTRERLASRKPRLERIGKLAAAPLPDHGAFITAAPPQVVIALPSCLLPRDVSAEF